MENTRSAVLLLLDGRRVCGRFRLEELIRSSFYVQVWLVSDHSGNRRLAKLTPINSNGSPWTAYQAERNVFITLTGGRIRPNRTVDFATPNGFPNIIFFGRHENRYDVIVTELLSTDVYNMRNRSRWRSLATTTGYLTILENMITVIETLHQHGFVHRNVKPQNIRLANSSFPVLFNFSVSKRYIDLITGHHVPMRRERIIVGTLKYASLHAHRLQTLSRRDDLISLGYSIIDVMQRGLPWSIFIQGSITTVESAALVMRAKENTSFESLCEGLPHCILRYLQTVYTMFYYDVPNYNFLREIVRSGSNQQV